MAVPGHTIPSTIIDYTSGEAVMLRKGERGSGDCSGIVK